METKYINEALTIINAKVTKENPLVDTRKLLELKLDTINKMHRAGWGERLND